MKVLNFFIFFFILISCSFDNKSGIWKNENSIEKKENELFKDFKSVSSTGNEFNKEIKPNKFLTISLSKPVSNSYWKDYFFNYNNNSLNYSYNNLNKILFKSKKLSRHNLNDKVLFDDGNLISNDTKGNIIIFSTNQNQIISKFNFYKKKYKKINKLLNLIVENDIIYISDNIGYLYAYNYKNKNILWAKNLKTPFRSNLKIIGNKIIASDEKNNLIFFYKKNGKIIKKIPTEETIINNKFRSNISTNNKDKLFFLNSYGTLYSINSNLLKINWFINLNFSEKITPNNLFLGVEIVNYKNDIIVSSLDKTYLIDINSGLIKKKFNFSSAIKPIINNNFVFFVTRNNFLLLINLENNKILFSQNINKKVAEFLDSKERNLSLLNFKLTNNFLKIFLKNSYVVDFDKNGKLNLIYKLPKKINSQPILIKNNILYLDKKNRIIILS